MSFRKTSLGDSGGDSGSEQGSIAPSTVGRRSPAASGQLSAAAAAAAAAAAQLSPPNIFHPEDNPLPLQRDAMRSQGQETPLLLTLLQVFL